MGPEEIDPNQSLKMNMGIHRLRSCERQDLMAV